MPGPPRVPREVTLKFCPVGRLQCRASALLRARAKAVGALNHPNVPAVFDVGAENGQPHVVAELLEGETPRYRILATPDGGSFA